MEIGVVLPSWVGDVAMATPALRALRNYFGPEAEITGVMRPYVAEVLADTPWLSRTVFYDRRSSDRAHHFWSAARQLRRRPLDKMLLFTNSCRAAALAWCSGATQRIGFVRNGRGPLLTDKLDPPKQGRRFLPVSVVDYCLDLAYRVGCPPEDRRLELTTRGADEIIAGEIWRRFGFSSASAVVTFNSGGAHGSARHWPNGHFVALARQIVDRTDAAVLVLCGPAEKEAAAEIERLAGHGRIRSMAKENTSLGVSKACIRRSQLMVTTDSGPRHLAAALGVPAVAVCGSVDFRRSLNYSHNEVVLRHDIDCAPCERRVCPLGHHRCMRELTPTRVFDAVAAQLATGGIPQAA